MAGSDPSVYNQLGANVVQPINPLTMQSQLYQTAGNALAIRGLLAKQAAGQAFQQSITPDGTTDQAALLKNLAADPGAAMAAQESAQAGQTLSHDEYAQHMQRLSYTANAGAQLLTNPGGPTMDAIKGAYDRAVQDGHITAADEAAVMQGFGPDPVQNAAIIKQRLFQNIGAQQALTNVLPNYTPTNTGGTTFFRDANPITNPNGMGSTGTGFTNTPGPQYVSTGGGNVPTTGGVPIPGAPVIPNTPTPGDRNATVQVFNPQTRRFEFQPKAAVVPLQNGDGTPATTPGAPAPTSAYPGLPSSGRVPTRGANPPPPMPTSSGPNATGGPTASNAAAPALGEPAEADASVAHASTARDAANNYTQRISPLVQAEGALNTADTGKGGETLNTVRSYVQNLTPGFLQSMIPSALTDPAQVAAYEEANKYLTANALGTPGATGSDARLGAAQGANASVHISNLAARQVVRAAIAQQRMTQAGTLAFNQSGQPAAGYDQFMNTWNTQQDPRAYVADKMAPGERAALVKGLGGVGSPAYQRFKASYQQGLTTQVIPQ